MKNLLLAEFVGNVWENGEFGVAASKTVKSKELDYRSNVLTEEEQVNWILNIVKVHGIEAALVYAREFFPLGESEPVDEQDSNGSIHLGLSILPNSHKRVVRGEKGITSYGRRLVRNACHRLEQENSKDVLSFLTLTLPSVSVSESVHIARNWSEIVRQFQQSLRRLLLKEGLPSEVVGVTELQLERFERSGVFGLHLHCVFVGRKPRSHWVVHWSQARRLWKNALKKYLEKDAEAYDWQACENIQRVRKSAQSYLGKYLSKGIHDMSKIREGYIDYVFPSSWYLCTLSLRERVHNRVMRVASDVASHLVDMASSKSCDDVFTYRKKVVLTTETGREIVIGWYGRLNEKGMKHLQQSFMDCSVERDNRIDKFLIIE